MGREKNMGTVERREGRGKKTGGEAKQYDTYGKS